MARRDPAPVRVLPDVNVLLPLWIAMHKDLKTGTLFRLIFDVLVDALRSLA